MTRDRSQTQVDPSTAGYAGPESFDIVTSTAGRQAWHDPYRADSTEDPDRQAIDVVYDLLSLISARLGLVAAVALGLSLMIGLYAYTLPSIFQSSAEVKLSPDVDTSLTDEGSGKDSRTTAYVTDQMRFLVSSPLAGRFIDSRQLSELSEILPTPPGISHRIGQLVGHVAMIVSSLGQRVASHTGIGKRLQSAEAGAPGNPEEEAVGSAKTVQRQRLIRTFGKALTVKTAAGLGRESGIMEVSFRAPQPETAQRLLQAYLDYYGQVASERLRESLESRRHTLKERYAQAEETLMQSETAAAEFVQAHGLFPRGNNELGHVPNLVNKSMERIVEAREEKERIRSLSGAETGSTMAAPWKKSDVGVLAELKQQLARLETQYEEQTAVYSRSFPKMIQLERRINDIREKLGNTKKETMAAALESAGLEEKVREHTLDEARKDATRLNHLQTLYTGLRRKVEKDDQVCQKLLSALEDVDIQLAAVPAGVNIIEPPSFSPRPVAPRRGLLLAVGIVLGLVSGLAVAWVVESLPSSRRVLDLEKTAIDIDARPLGIVPDFATFDGVGRSKHQINTSPLFQQDASGKTVSHIIRDVETALYFFPAGEKSKIVMVSSALADEGKTFLAASLACAMSSREGQKTLVLDADMRRPTLHKLFGRETPGDGLSTVLTDKNAALSQLIHRSQCPGLFYLTAGPVPEDPLALLRSKRFSQVLCALERYFDNIVIDSPPVLSVPDYMPLCHAAKQVILVVEQGKTLREEVRRCAGLIRCVSGARIFGVILNKVQTSAGRYSSAGHYNSRYHYRYRERYCKKAS